MVYIIHFDEPLSHARHYVGYCSDKEGALGERMCQHFQKKGAKILKACREKGIHFEVVRTLPGGRDRERRIKSQKNTWRLCPVCRKRRKDRK